MSNLPTVFVTGGAGLVGSAVVRQLASRGHAVVVYDNLATGRREFVEGIPGVTLVTGDVLVAEALRAALRNSKATRAIHCVGDTYVPSSYVVPDRFFSINVLGTLGALKASLAANVEKFVLLSSAEVYGQLPGPISESERLAPVNTYAVSKLAADRLCATFQTEHGLPCVVLRLFNTYGPRETHPYVVPEIIRQLSRGPTLRLGNIEARRDFTYVDDTARAIVDCMEVDQGSVINIGSGHAVSVRDLVSQIARLMGIAADVRLSPDRLRRQDIDTLVCDNSRLVSITGWHPTVDIEEGLRRTIAWFRENSCQWPWERTEFDPIVNLGPDFV